ncbi:alpha/beta hydrolase family protein [Chitinophaga flava]|uniref:Alpha/beta hydrolase n=1 Tax=Chitinophaga flava TaxID=2259036 RepID=A0A365XSN4_9BACT|nr:alpha/beta hydrolase [Chitinophaga flava]RBL89377.1 alpha/beta hydrolase [Chitinophaga flava]
MKSTCTLLLLLITISFSLQAQNVKGVWIGTLKLEGDPPQVAFEIFEDIEGGLHSLMHVINQKNFNIKVENLRVTGKDLQMDIPTMSAHFEGQLVNDSTIAGFLLMNDKRKFTLNLTRTAALPVVKLRRPQEPVPPLPYREEDVVFVNKAAGVSLAGTLSLPPGGSRFPAVVLISGSGPNDRNETIFTHKVFLVLADYLTRAGIAVLRVDDRGVGNSTGDYESATNEDLAADALAGVQYLQTRHEINPQAVGLIGHSLGGEIAPIAALSPEVAFVVLMAGSACPAEVSYYEGCEAVGKLHGATPQGIATNRKVLDAVFNIIKTEPNDSIAKLKLAARLKELDPEVAKLSAKDRLIMELSHPLRVEDFLSLLSVPRRADFARDLVAIVKQVKCPVLAMNGSKDQQVMPSQLKRIEKALHAGGNKQVTIKLFEGKNHLFQNAKTGSVSEYEEIEETIAPDVLAYMATWIKQRRIK